MMMPPKTLQTNVCGEKRRRLRKCPDASVLDAKRRFLDAKRRLLDARTLPFNAIFQKKVQCWGVKGFDRLLKKIGKIFGFN